MGIFPQYEEIIYMHCQFFSFDSLISNQKQGTQDEEIKNGEIENSRVVTDKSIRLIRLPERSAQVGYRCLWWEGFCKKQSAATSNRCSYLLVGRRPNSAVVIIKPAIPLSLQRLFSPILACYSRNLRGRAFSLSPGLPTPEGPQLK
jgi:hypothetical protein